MIMISPVNVQTNFIKQSAQPKTRRTITSTYITNRPFDISLHKRIPTTEVSFIGGFISINPTASFGTRKNFSWEVAGNKLSSNRQ